tara:strand:+ start:417 stop:1028 length:612 start_codon:yes stop_codon:yes gene_type:complete
MSKKPIITFEGIEGSGKTTQINFVTRFLKKKKIKYIKLREPGGSKNSEKIRKLILGNKSTFNAKTDLLLYLASRSENIEKIITKNYKKKVILIDRFIHSTLAYQHYGMNLDKKLIIKLNSYLLKKIKVDFTFLHIVNKKNLFQRLNKRKNKNRYDKFNFNFYSKVQKGFLKQSNKKKFMVINSDYKIYDNKKKIISKISKLIK